MDKTTGEGGGFGCGGVQGWEKMQTTVIEQQLKKCFKKE